MSFHIEGIYFYISIWKLRKWYQNEAQITKLNTISNGYERVESSEVAVEKERTHRTCSCTALMIRVNTPSEAPITYRGTTEGEVSPCTLSFVELRGLCERLRFDRLT